MRYFYLEQLTPEGAGLVLADGETLVTVLEVHRMGPDLKWRYVVAVDA